MVATDGKKAPALVQHLVMVDPALTARQLAPFNNLFGL
jgi:hypothetical protein